MRDLNIYETSQVSGNGDLTTGFAFLVPGVAMISAALFYESLGLPEVAMIYLSGAGLGLTAVGGLVLFND